MPTVYHEGLMDIPASVAKRVVGKVRTKKAYRQPKTSRRVKSIYKFTLTNPMEGTPHRLEIVVYRRGRHCRTVWAIRGSRQDCIHAFCTLRDGDYKRVPKRAQA